MGASDAVTEAAAAIVGALKPPDDSVDASALVVLADASVLAHAGSLEV